MRTNRTWVIILLVAAAAPAQRQASGVQEPLAERLARMTDADVAAYAESALRHGMTLDWTTYLPELVRMRAGVALPALERGIEQVVESGSPADYFTERTIDARSAVRLAAGMIAYAEDENALKELSKLMQHDGSRFGLDSRLLRVLVGEVLNDGGDRNFFPLVYRGFEIGSAALDNAMIAWITRQFEEQAGARQTYLKQWWAEALAQKNGHAINEFEWIHDPIASRLKPELAISVRDEVMRRAADIAYSSKK